MFKRLGLFLLIVLLFALVFPISAQDAPLVTNTPNEVIGVEVTPAPAPVVIVTPAPTPAPVVEQAHWWDNPLVVTIAIYTAALLFFMLSQQTTIRTHIVQAGTTAPTFLYAGIKEAVLGALSDLEGLAKNTPDTTVDDEEAARIRQIVVSILSDIDRSREGTFANGQYAEKALSRDRPSN